jgi:hypothetical protein
VRWTKPTIDGGSPVINYLLEINTKPSVNTVNTYAVITGLKPNTKYTVKVYARNIVGYGNVSTIVSTTKKQGNFQKVMSLFMLFPYKCILSNVNKK